VPRWSKPRAADLDVDLLDRAHRHGFHPYVSALTIEDTNPDTQAPTVVAATVAPARVDVRGADQPVDVTAHITDDRSGLGYAVACLIHQSADGSYGGNGGCMMMNRTRGTATDGWYDADPVIPKGSVGGSWNVVLETQDQVSNSANWLGPDAYRTWPCMGICPDPTAHQLPNGQGRVDVTGVSDPTPPQLQLLSVTPARVDTLPGPVTVSFDVRATDNDGDGINAVGLFLGYNGDAWNGAGPDFNPPDVTAPATGSPTDGTWHVEVTLPQGAPPGVYVPELWVRDAGHWVSYVPPSSPYANQPNQQVMTPAQLGGSDGTVTVVDHTS
jgi:hypothetical protein